MRTPQNNSSKYTKFCLVYMLWTSFHFKNKLTLLMMTAVT